MKTITIKTDGESCAGCPQLRYGIDGCFCCQNLWNTRSHLIQPSKNCPGSGEYVLVEKQEYLNMKAQIGDIETGGDE